jgi:hypothetical protein
MSDIDPTRLLTDNFFLGSLREQFAPLQGNKVEARDLLRAFIGETIERDARWPTCKVGQAGKLKAAKLARLNWTSAKTATPKTNAEKCNEMAFKRWGM